MEKHKIDLLYPKIASNHVCRYNELERHRVGLIDPFGSLAVGLQKSTVRTQFESRHQNLKTNEMTS